MWNSVLRPQVYFFVLAEEFRLDGLFFGNEGGAAFDEVESGWTLDGEVLQQNGGQRRRNSQVTVTRVLQIIPGRIAEIIHITKLNYTLS